MLSRTENIGKFVHNNIKDSPGDTIVVWEEMLRDGSIPHIDVQDDTYKNYTALMYQVLYGTEEGMEWLLTREPPANIDLQNDNEDSALMIAVHYYDPAKVRLLLDYGANRYITNGSGGNALSFAKILKSEDTAIIELLEKHYPDKRDPASERRRVDEKGVERVFSRFVRNNIEGSPGDTIDVWRKMLRDGRIPHVNVQIVNNDYNTALMYQAKFGTKEGMLWLLTRDPPANVDIQDKGGKTALMLAVEKNSPAKVKLLLKYRADRSIRTSIGDTAFSIAKAPIKERRNPKPNYYPIFRLDDRDTPISIAKRVDKDPAIIELLDNYYPGNNRVEQVAFNRSRIFTVGLFGSGKTSLTLSLRGLPPRDNVSSTVGMEAFSFDVSDAGVMGGDGGCERVDWGHVPSEDYDASVRAVAKARQQSLEKMREKKKMEIDNTYRTMKSNIFATNTKTNTSKDAILKPSGVPVKPLCLVDIVDSNRFIRSTIEQEDSMNDVYKEDNGSGIYGPKGTFGFRRSLRKALNVPVKKEVMEAKEVPNVDLSEVVKCLSDKIQTKSKFIISLYDFGGQTVFDVIHPFFMTRFGVYTLVFNMLDILSRNGESSYKLCMDSIKFWLDTIAIHTLSKVETNLSALTAGGGSKGGGGGYDAMNIKLQTSPIAIVGTWKDKVEGLSDHVAISQILEDNFGGHIAFKSRIVYDSSNAGCKLNFFPINNKEGRKDPTVLDLMSVIEKEIDSSDYVHEKKSLSWLQTFDKLKSLKRPHFDYKEVVGVGHTFGVVPSAIPNMLALLHDMGMLMWHKEASLRNTVIMDPIKFFVDPVTNIICQHETKCIDGVERNHYRPIHGEAMMIFPRDYERLKKGLVSERLMQLMLKECSNNSDKVLKLMIKYGLACELSSTDASLCLLLDKDSLHSPIKNNINPSDNCGGGVDFKSDSEPKDACKSYLIPSLLPLISSTVDNSLYADYTSFYFLFFSSSQNLNNRKCITWTEIATHGFLPVGLFDRLVCRAVSWSQVTLIEHAEVNLSNLFKDLAMLKYGGQNFRITYIASRNSIRVDVEVRHAYGIYMFLKHQIENIIKECLKSLQFVPTLLCCTSEATIALHVLVSDAIDLVQKPDSVLEYYKNGKAVTISGSNLNAQYPRLLISLDLMPSYDVFISYRPDEKDRPDKDKPQCNYNDMVESLFDRLTLYSIGSTKRAIDTYLYSRRLKGEVLLEKVAKPLEEKAKALSCSAIVIIVLSSFALAKMTKEEEIINDVLVEWIISLECCRSKKALGIFPIIFTDINAILDELSTDKPEFSIEEARRLMIENNLPFDKKRMKNYTFKSIVHEIYRESLERSPKFGCCVWEIQNNVYANVASKLRDYIADNEVSINRTRSSNISSTGTVSSTSAVVVSPSKPVITNDDIHLSLQRIEERQEDLARQNKTQLGRIEDKVEGLKQIIIDGFSKASDRFAAILDAENVCNNNYEDTKTLILALANNTGSLIKHIESNRDAVPNLLSLMKSLETKLSTDHQDMIDELCSILSNIKVCMNINKARAGEQNQEILEQLGGLRKLFIDKLAEIDNKLDKLAIKVVRGFAKVNGGVRQLLDRAAADGDTYEDSKAFMTSLDQTTRQMMEHIRTHPAEAPDMSHLFAALESKLSSKHQENVNELKQHISEIKGDLEKNKDSHHEKILKLVTELSQSFQNKASESELSLVKMAELHTEITNKLDTIANMSTTILTDTHGLPTLFIVIPDPEPAGFFTRFIKDRYRLFFVCGYSHQLALSGRDKRGYSFSAEKGWVTKVKPLLKLMLSVIKTGLSITFPGIPIPIPLPDVDFKAAGIDTSMSKLVDMSVKLVEEEASDAVNGVVEDAKTWASSNKCSGVPTDVKLDWGSEGTKEMYKMVKSVLSSEQIKDFDLNHTGLKWILAGDSEGPNRGKARWIYDLPEVEESYHASLVPTERAMRAIERHKIHVLSTSTSNGSGSGICEERIEATLIQEKEALTAFYHATGGSTSWRNRKNWLVYDKPVSGWYGVEVNKQGFVVKLKLANNNLTGCIPMLNCLGSLMYLQKVRLGDNKNLLGPLPSSDLHRLRALVYFLVDKRAFNLPADWENRSAVEQRAYIADQASRGQGGGGGSRSGDGDYEDPDAK